MKVKVFKKDDGGVVYFYPNKKFQGGFFVDDISKPITKEGKILGYAQRELTIDDCKVPLKYSGLEFIIIDEFDLIDSNSKTNNLHEMIYFDGDCKKENMKQDKEWKKVLMPNFLVKNNHLKNLNDDIDNELAKENPDQIKLLRLTRRKEVESKVHASDRKFWAQKALDGLDRRKANGESDKLAIRKKLKEILAEK